MKKILVVTMAAVMLTACGGTKTATPVRFNPATAVIACDNSEVAYKLPDSTLQFCYDKLWGEPVVTNLKAEVGFGKILSFGTADNSKAPKIWLATRDFKPTNPSDKLADMSGIDGTVADADLLKKQVNAASGYDEKDVSARKTDISGARSVRADVGGDVKQIMYYVSNAFGDYDMVIYGGKDIAESVDNLVFDMIL